MYTTATFARLDRNANGTASIVLLYTGDSGENPVEDAYPINANVMPTADYMRGLAMARLSTLNNNRNFIAGALAAVGTILDTTTPLPPPTPLVSTFGAYMAASAPFTPGAAPTDVFSITGSATKTIQVICMGLTAVQTTAGMGAWSMVKRSTANSGGTSALVPGVPTDDAHPAATATVRQYTANPTLGSLIGSVWSGRIAAPAPASAPAGDFERRVLFVESRMRTVTLSGISDVLAWNFGGVALPAGLSLQATVWWEES